MNFIPTRLPGAYIIDIEPHTDDRGFFARTWCAKEMAEHGCNPTVAQASLSYNEKKGTLRGMHYQASPHEEAKLVRCTQGAIHDVIIDIRPESSTYKQWISVTLSANNHRALYIPEGFAHGFITLEDHTEVFYMISQFYTPGAGRGIRYDDPAFAIDWPIPIQMISEKDENWPDFLSDR